MRPSVITKLLSFDELKFFKKCGTGIALSGSGKQVSLQGCATFFTEDEYSRTGAANLANALSNVQKTTVVI
jgi:hypothetical protein